MSELDVQVRLANWNSPVDRSAVVHLLDMYASDPFGGGEPLSADVRERLIPDLQQLGSCRAFLAIVDEQPVGLALCFFGYSSFHARPLLNIHDLAVSPQLRGRGVGRALLRAVEELARTAGCCRLTLEVRADNEVARQLYQSFGFQPGDPASDALSFWKKPLA